MPTRSPRKNPLARKRKSADYRILRRSPPAQRPHRTVWGRIGEPPRMPRAGANGARAGQAVGLGEIRAPSRFGLAPVHRVHDEQFIEFLSSAWADWAAAGNRGEAIPDCWPARRMTQRVPTGISGKLGYYAMAAETSISAGSWEAACAAADVALTAADLLHRGATLGVRTMPPSRPSCSAGSVRRLLLFEQRRHRRPIPARPGRRAGCDPRCRFPSRQRHSGHLL